MAKSKRSAKSKAKDVLSRRVVMYAVGGAVAGLCVVGVAAVFAWAPDRSPAPVETAGVALPSKKASPPPVAARTTPAELAPAPAPSVLPPRPESEPVAPAFTGAPPWQRFALPTPPQPGPRVAIVIDDAGLDHGRTARAIALPGPLTISFLTYGEGLIPQVRAAHSAGHELMLHVAMEATSRTVDPGPDVLLRDIEPDELMARLRRVLAKFDGYVGVNNHMGSLFTADVPSMQLLLGELKRHGLLFLDSRTGPDTVGAKVARSLDLPFAERDVFLDNDPIESKVDRQLAELERVARAKGVGIAIGHPRDGTLDALAKWIPDAKARGFVFVPVSAIVRDNVARGAVSARR